ncbi:MAG TPA: glycosyltransferase family 4 protein [Candidatus Polarisedimenticolia bacterium]|nr:glycosyltransferase family 4 protein [Candidatus Polarisedimenticolia bacterium]
MRIAYLVSLFPKLSETFILRELLALADRGHELTILSLKSEREPVVHEQARPLLGSAIYPRYGRPMAAAALHFAWRRPGALAGVVMRIAAAHRSHPRLLFTSLALIPIALLFARRLRGERVEHLHAHWATHPATTAWIIHRMTGIPYSVTGHAHDLFLPNPMLPLKLRESSFFATISEFNRAILIQRCGPAALEKLRLVRCGLPIGEFPLRPAAARGPGDGEVTVLSVGRMVDYKGFDVLLRACSWLRAEGRAVRCVLAGDGPERSALRELASKLQVPAEFPGPLAQDGVAALMRQADLFVLACVRGRDGQQDGIPIVLMEAMAAGVPVVSTKLSGIPELVIDRRTGLLAAPGDDEHLARAMGRLLDDPPLAASLAAAARAHVEKEFDLAVSASALEREFERSARRPPGRRAEATA